MNTLAKAKSLGGERAFVVAMIFVFLIGVALGSVTAYPVAKAVKEPTAVPGPSPAEPAAEACIVKGKGKGNQAPLTRRPNAGTIVITKTEESYHREVCTYLAVGDRTNANRKFGRFSVCYRDD